MLYGLYSPDRAVAALREVIGWPMRLGNTRVSESGKQLRGAASASGKEMFSSEMAAKSGGSANAGGVLHYPLLRQRPNASGSEGELIVHKVPWTAKVQMADPVSVKLNFPDNHPIMKLQPKKLLYAYFGKDVNFAFGHIQVIGPKADSLTAR